MDILLLKVLVKEEEEKGYSWMTSSLWLLAVLRGLLQEAFPPTSALVRELPEYLALLILTPPNVLYMPTYCSLCPTR